MLLVRIILMNKYIRMPSLSLSHSLSLFTQCMSIAVPVAIHIRNHNFNCIICIFIVYDIEINIDNMAWWESLRRCSGSIARKPLQR